MLQTSTTVLIICLLFTIYQVVFENPVKCCSGCFHSRLASQPEEGIVSLIFFFFFSFETKWKALVEQMIFRATLFFTRK